MGPIKARAPLDVDLEDKLIFGLTPVRFAYLAVGAVGAYTLGLHGPLPGVVRVPLGAVLLAAAALFAWVRWRGRPLDAWALDLAIHARRNLEVEIDPVMLGRIRAPLRRPVRPRRSKPVAPQQPPAQSTSLRPTVRRQQPLPTISVRGLGPGSGATTVAVELGAALALKGRRVAIDQVGGGDLSDRLRGSTGLRLGPPRADDGDECVVIDLGTRLRREKVDLALLVSDRESPAALRATPGAAHTALVVNRAGPLRPGQPAAITRVPLDAAVPSAQAAGEPVLLRFPASAAARAFHRLADEVDPGRDGPWRAGSEEAPPAG